MQKYVDKPHLPEGRTEILAIGEKYREKLGKPLKEHEITAIWIPDAPDIDTRLSGHADLNLLHLGGDKLLIASYLREIFSFVKIFTKLNFQIVFSELKRDKDYPNDAGLCVSRVGDYFFCRKDIVDPIMASYWNDADLININQGYAKCSICVVDRRSIITSDPGIENAAKRRGIDVLKISSGSIALDGFDCGFIGGSTFKLSNNELAFTGTIDEHPDGQRITDYLISKNITPIFLTNEPLFDIGGAIPLIERN